MESGCMDRPPWPPLPATTLKPLRTNHMPLRAIFTTSHDSLLIISHARAAHLSCGPFSSYTANRPPLLSPRYFVPSLSYSSPLRCTHSPLNSLFAYITIPSLPHPSFHHLDHLVRNHDPFKFETQMLPSSHPTAASQTCALLSAWKMERLSNSRMRSSRSMAMPCTESSSSNSDST